MEILGITLPLWTIFVGGIILLLLAWKIIKFTIKIVLIVGAFLVVLILLDVNGVFTEVFKILNPVLPI